MDANARLIGTKMAFGLLGCEKRAFFGLRDPDIIFGSQGGK
jgi:hypothetical protein